jgi:hypothetical protein
MSRLETGKVLNPTLATLHKWAEGLGQGLEVDLLAGFVIGLARFCCSTGLTFYLAIGPLDFNGRIAVTQSCNMMAQGRVQNGVVVPADSVRLPVGQEVTFVARPGEPAKTHSILDIPSVSVGGVLRPLGGDDYFPGEMREGRS